jgi:hypothetical protein
MTEKQQENLLVAVSNIAAHTEWIARLIAEHNEIVRDTVRMITLATDSLSQAIAKQKRPARPG